MLGVNLIVHSRDNDHIINLENVISENGVELIKTSSELSDLEQLTKLFKFIDNLNIDVEIVYNNAGLSPSHNKNEWSVSPDDYLECFKVNTIAPIRICYHFLPLMLSKGFGRIINTSSSIQKRPLEMAYSCSKAALDKYVYDIAPSLKHTGVAISLLDPGWLSTDMGGVIAPNTPETVLPGALLGAVMGEKINGHWITAQDYSGLDLNEALNKAYSDLL